MIRRPVGIMLLAALPLAWLAAACDVTRSTPSPAMTPGPDATIPTTNPATDGPPASAPASPAPGAPTAPSDPLVLEDILVSLEPFAVVEGGALAVAAPDDGSGRLFVATQDGRIWVVTSDGTVLGEPMIDLGKLLSRGGEQGLLGIAAHPSFPTDPRIFVAYTDLSGDTVVASLSLSAGDPNRLEAGSRREFLFVDQPFANHNGVALAFGPDGYLYVSLGDGGSGGDPLGNGQSLRTLLGKILRIDVDQNPRGPHAVPADNPFVSGGGLPEIWHWGLRNPWRMSFDRATADLWIGDVGQGQWEEVDVGRQGASGLNFGWNVMEGAHCYRAEACDDSGLTLPVAEYGHDVGCSVVGGYVYRGTRYPILAGAYLFADYCSGAVLAIDARADTVAEPVAVGSASGRNIAGFGETADGELLVLVLNGSIFRVVASAR